MPAETRLTLELQDRDLELLRGLFESRLMTLSQASGIYFGGAREATKKRVNKLKTAGLVTERARKPYEPSILFLSRAGYALLQERGFLYDMPKHGWAALERRLQISQLTLRHELEVMDVKAAFHSDARAHAAYSVTEFTTWPMLCEFTASPGRSIEKLVKPDGFLRIEETDATEVFEHLFFLELDRGTEGLDELVRKALCYRDYYQRGGLAVRFGHSPSEYKEFPFRVLMVLKTAERRNNVAEALLTTSSPIFTMVWLATLPEVISNPFLPIWVRPRDYATAVDGSPYSVIKPDRRSIYRRQIERERFVESRVTKHSLIEPDSAGG